MHQHLGCSGNLLGRFPRARKSTGLRVKKPGASLVSLGDFRQIVSSGLLEGYSRTSVQLEGSAGGCQERWTLKVGANLSRLPLNGTQPEWERLLGWLQTLQTHVAASRVVNVVWELVSLACGFSSSTY